MAERRKTPKNPLEQKAEWVQHLLEDVQKDAFSGDEREISGEVSVVDQHEADIASVVYEREQEETMRQVLQRDAAQIEDARRRMAEGAYGICEDCGAYTSVAPGFLARVDEPTVPAEPRKTRS